MNKTSWILRLKEKWNLGNTWQVVVVLIVFACTGFTVLFLKRPILELITGSDNTSTVTTIVYYLLILPFYNILLLMYGFVFGQFRFFWNFEKRFFKRIISIFKKH